MTKRRAPRPASRPAPLAEVRDRLSPKAAKRLDEAMEVVRRLIEEALPSESSFEEHERAVLEITNEIARRQLERKLQGIADSYPLKLRIEHNEDWHGWREVPAVEYHRHLPGTVTYHSLVGGLRIRRHTYREPVRNGVTYVPLELDTGLMEHMTPGLARATTYAYALMPIRDADALLRCAGRRPPSRSTLDRCARDLGTYAIASHPAIEPAVRAAERVPDDAHAIVLGTDRTAVLMRNNDPDRAAGEVGRDLRRPRLKHRRSPLDPKGVSWRMDYVATVTFVDQRGERIASYEYRVPANAEPRHAAERMMLDVAHALAQRPTLKIVVVQDGAPELWNLLRDHLETVPAVSTWHEVLDWYHVAERLAVCADLCCDEPAARAAQRDAWTHTLLTHRHGATSFLRSLARCARRVDGDDNAAAIQSHLAFFRRRKAQLCYPQTRARGFPIGSGITEGCCKSLVGARAKRSGQHWHQRGLSAALHWRAVIASDRFDATWSAFAARYRASALAPS